MVRHVFDLDLGLPLLGDVLVGGDPAAAGHRPVADLDGASVLQLDDAVFGYVGDRHIGAPAQIFIPGHRRKAAGLEAKIDDFNQRRAGTDAAERDIVHLDETVVAHDQAVVGIEEAQPLRHVVDRGVELEVADPQRLFLLPSELVLLLQAGMEFLALGDVLVGRHPAAAGHRVDGVGDDPSVGEFLDRGVERDVPPDALANVFIGRPRDFQAELQPVPDQFAGRRARLHLFGREPVHLHVALVAEDDLPLLVEDDNAERQMVDRLFKPLTQVSRLGTDGTRN